MSFIKLVLKNPFRKKFKSILTVIIITIIVISIIFLSTLASSSEYTANKSFTAGGDFIVQGNISIFNINSENFTNIIPLNDTLVNQIKNISGVEKVTPFKSNSFEVDNTYFFVRDITLDTFNETDNKIIKGSFPKNNNEVLIGTYASKDFDKNVGDELTMFNKTYHVSGIFAGNYKFGFDIFMLPEALNQTNENVFIDLIIVDVKKGSDLNKIKKSVNSLNSGKIQAASSFNEIYENKKTIEVMNDVSNYISIFAIVVGGLLTFYVMLSSVNNRIRELGVLKAIGWDNKHIIALIVGESIVITFVSWIIGTILSVILIYYLFNNVLHLTIMLDVWIFIKTIIIVLVIGAIGSLYPAIKATKISPTESLRYEN